MFVREAWYCAAWGHELSEKPLSRRILGVDLVFFRNREGKIAALDATCPHRGANLAHGKVVDGTVECPFHGWRFDGGGHCVRVPSQPDGHPIPAGAKVRTYAVREQQEIVWIWMAEVAPYVEPPRYAFMEPEAGMRRVKDIADLGAGPFISVVENAIDNSHPPFIHPDSLAGEPQIVENQLVKLDDDRRGFWAQLDPASDWKGPSNGTAGLLGLWRRAFGVTELDRKKCYFRFDLGGVVYFFDTFTSGHTQIGFAAVTPADDTHTWFFGEHIRSFAKSSIFDRPIAAWMRQINAEDLAWVARLLSSDRAHGLPRPVSCIADRPALAFRQVYFQALRRENAEAQTPVDSAEFLALAS